MKVAVINIGPGVICLSLSRRKLSRGQPVQVIHEQLMQSRNNNISSSEQSQADTGEGRYNLNTFWSTGYCPPQSKIQSNSKRTIPEVISCLLPVRFSPSDINSCPTDWRNKKPPTIPLPIINRKVTVKPPIKISNKAASRQRTHWAGNLIVLRVIPIATVTIKAVIAGVIPLNTFFTAGIFP